MSTGMSDLTEIYKSVSILKKFGVKNRNLILLHCNTEYPTPFDDVNLKAMILLKENLDAKLDILIIQMVLRCQLLRLRWVPK